MKKKLTLLTLVIVIALITTVAGCAGEPGLKGDQGPIGLQGEQGEPGPQGIQGTRGLKGEQGEPGIQGVMGKAGAKGATGSTGAKGEQGIQGEQGPAGSRGSSGSRGSTGSAGPAGPAGSDADCGDLQDQINVLVARLFALENPTPKIDGVISPCEWNCATVIDVAGDMGTVSIIAYTDYLYVLFNVVDTTDARLGENIHGNDQTSININPSAGEPWGLPCDIIFQMGADPNAWGGTSSGQTDGWETDWEIDGTQQLSLPGDLKTKTLYNYGTGTRVSEWKIPLTSITPSQGDTVKVGGAIDVGDGSSYVYPPGLDWGDTGTYVGILVR